MEQEERFTPEETVKLKAARQIISEVKIARRERLGLPTKEEAAKAAKEEAKRLAEEERERLRQAGLKADLEKKAARKKDFDDRIRLCLIAFTDSLKNRSIRILDDQYANGFYNYGSGQTLRTKVFTVFDNKTNEKPTDIYWVYGKGFEWK